MRFFHRNNKEGRLTDQELLVMIRNGGREEEQALDDLYDKLRPRIVEWVRKNGGSRDDGEDAFQIAMMAFYDYLRGDRFGGEQKVRAFLWQTARNGWHLKCRRNGKEPPLHDDFDPPDASYQRMLSDLFNDEENRKAIIGMINRACPSCCELLTLQFFRGYSNEALADHFGNKENSVKVKRSNCLKKLREYLRNHPEEQSLFSSPVSLINSK